MNISREKFHTFDALRFFSFFLVFLSHLPYRLFPQFDFLQTRGDIGVSFFFTLSGFLISYILLAEKSAVGNFDFRKYMARRILRIWPLYYLVLLFAFCTPYILSILGLTQGNGGYEPNWFFSAAFLENYMMIYHNDFANVSPLPVIWSLCIEEHFYIIWGLILYFTKAKNIPYWILGIVITSIISRFVFDWNGWIFKEILTNFDAFMFGAIPAYLYVFHRDVLLEKINSVGFAVKVLWVSITLVFTFGAYHFDYPYQKFIEPIVLGMLFMGILLLMLPKENKFKIGNRNLFSRLGVYTYGLYLFHIIFINLMIKLFQKTDWNTNDFTKMFLISFSSLLGTIVVAICSYHFFEKQFLRLKPSR